MLYLKTNRLTVEISEPEEAPNNKFRFDRTGFISEVILDNDMRFCASEPRYLWHPSSGGRGICSEIIFDCSEEVDIGEEYPKFGIGTLRKQDEKPYIFYNEYETNRFSIDVSQEDNRIKYTVSPRICNGYALWQEKTIDVADNTISITHIIKNVGTRPIDLQEYNHNIFSIDGMAIGNGYVFQFDNILPEADERIQSSLAEKQVNLEYLSGGCFQIREYSKGVTLYEIPHDVFSNAAGLQWEVRNTDAHAKIVIKEGFCPETVKIWAVDHIVSAEVFVRRQLQVGESAIWKREWVFDYL